MNVRELRALLADAPDDALVAISGEAAGDTFMLAARAEVTPLFLLEGINESESRLFKPTSAGGAKPTLALYPPPPVVDPYPDPGEDTFEGEPDALAMQLYHLDDAFPEFGAYSDLLVRATSEREAREIAQMFVATHSDVPKADLTVWTNPVKSVARRVRLEGKQGVVLFAIARSRTKSA